MPVGIADTTAGFNQLLAPPSSAFANLVPVAGVVGNQRSSGTRKRFCLSRKKTE